MGSAYQIGQEVCYPPERVVAALRRFWPRLSLRWNVPRQAWWVMHPWSPLDDRLTSKPYRPDDPDVFEWTMVYGLRDSELRGMPCPERDIVEKVRQKFWGRGKEADQRWLAEDAAEDAEARQHSERYWATEGGPAAEDVYFEHKAIVAPGVRPKGGWPVPERGQATL